MKKYVRALLYFISSIRPLRRFLRVLAHHGVLPAFLYKRLPVDGVFSVAVSPHRSFFYHSSVGDQIGRFLYWNGKGGGEPETFSYFQKCIEDAKTFVDVGANTGHFTLYACALNPDLKAYVFEPVPRVFDVLEKNIALNAFESRIERSSTAVGKKDGTVAFHIPFDDVPTSASLNPEGFNSIEGELVETSILRLDTFFKDKPAPDFIKIDVEGYEHHVLEGCAGLFEAGHRPGLILECNPGGPGKKITEILKPLGYEFLHLIPKGTESAAEISSSEGEAYRNWAAIHPNNAEEKKAA